MFRIKLSPGNTEASLARPTPDARVERALALADAIVTSPGGEFNLGTSPLLIVADFPVKHGIGAAATDKSKAAEFSSSPLVVGAVRLFKTS